MFVRLSPARPLVLCAILVLPGANRNLRAAISSITPQSALAGAIVNIAGDNFDAEPTNNIVQFGAVRAAVSAASATNLAVVVPKGATYAPIVVTARGFTARSNQRFLPTFAGDGSPVSSSTFAPAQNLATDNGPLETVIADLDGDGKPDIIVANAYSHTVSVFRNVAAAGSLSANSFAAPFSVTLPLGAGSDNPIGIEAADLDGDGKLDILVCDRANDRILVCRNVATPGTLTTNSFAAAVSLGTASDPRHVRVADIDGDGKPDILAACYGASVISILRNTGSAGNLTTNSFAAKVDLPVGSGVYDVAIADLDGDSKPDVAAADTSASYISVFRNISSAGTIDANSFDAEIQIPSLNYCQSIIATDIDGDGQLDLVAGSIQGNAMSVLRNMSTPGSIAFADHVDFGAPGWVHNVTAADINGDGRPDIVIDGELNSYMAIFQNGSALGDFTSASLSNRVDYATGWNAWGISVGDLDGDGRPDVLFCNAYDNNLTLYRNITPVAGGPHHFEWNLIPSPRFTNAAFAVTIIARDATNGTFTNFSASVLLSSTNGASVLPGASGSFIQGVWAGTIAVAQVASNVVFVADDGLGHEGLSNPVNVVAPPSLSVARSGNFLLIYWPSAPPGFVLESSSSLSSASWSRVPGTPAQIGDRYLASIQVPAQNGFYRLRYTGP